MPRKIDQLVVKKKERIRTLLPPTPDKVSEQAIRVIEFWRAVGPREGGFDRSFVYLIREVDGGPVKLGWAVDPMKRLKLLQCGNPRELVIVRAIEGGLMEEGIMHTAFSSWRDRGEWFRNTDELLAVFESIADGQIAEHGTPHPPLRWNQPYSHYFDRLVVRAMFPLPEKDAA